MKLLLALTFVMIASYATTSVSASAAELICSNGDNLSYVLNYTQGIRLTSAKLTIVDAQGVADASGTLKCDGPNESAFLCEGNINQLNEMTGDFTGPAKPISLIFPESTLQTGQGQIKLGDSFYPCLPR